MNNATPNPQPLSQPPVTQLLARWSPTRGIWETSQPDRYGQPAEYWQIWPSSGLMLDGSVYPPPPSVLHTIASASSSSLGALLRTPLASDSSRGGESMEQVKARHGTIALSHQIIDLALHGPHGSPRQSRGSETLWSLIEDIFDAGDATPTPSDVGNTSPAEKPRHPRS